jgi:predicted nuclease of predicted toxin-antitoxin system
VKFIVDAQLPRQLSVFLLRKGHDSIHTLDLPKQNATDDNSINAIADSEGRIVITKDGDFVASHLIAAKPKQLLFVSTGNISNSELLKNFEIHLDKICNFFETHSFIEITKDIIITRK